MEINQPVASEVSSHGGSPDHEQEVQSQSQQQQPRSYECNFCKKGFSNAQALGGHMNIHRKDKAKANFNLNLKQPSSKQQPHHHQRLNMMDNCTKALDITSKRPGIYSSGHLLESSYPSPRDGTHVSELKQLPLFVEKATNYSNNPLIHPASANWHDDLQSNHGSFGADLDLELRLGHVPPKSSVAMGTRKFF